MNPYVIAGFAFILAGLGGTVVQLSSVGISAGPFSASLGGVSAFTATTVFIGIALIIIGVRQGHAEG